MKYIDNYRVTGLLGKGGTAKVYKVEIPVIKKIAALKHLDPNPFLVDLMGMDDIIRLFVAEASTMAKLRHPAITDIWNFGEAAGRPFYIMDYYAHNLGDMMGETYRVEDPSRIIALDKAAAYMCQTLDGLACLHHAGIVHRDIKPFNILITDQDTVKICDFGLSKARGEVFNGPQGLKIGTPYYAAPEQEKNPESADERSDLFSVGVIFYRMLTGQLPGDPIQSPSTLNPALDHHWDFFFNSALSPRRHERFGSAKQMLSALVDLVHKWQQKKEQVCELPPEQVSPEPADDQTVVSLRKALIKVRASRAREAFNTDALWRPTTYISNRFSTQSRSRTVSDEATGLIWQYNGEAYPVNWYQAGDYIQNLNRMAFAGLISWRLPTVEELMSLLTNTRRPEDLCLEPVFDPGQKWLWSCDRQSYTSAWYVSTEMGYVSWNDLSAYQHVKAVCGQSATLSV
jgi:serine/threonine protein kinase